VLRMVIPLTAVFQERLNFVMGAVEQEEKSVPFSPENEPIIQSVSAFHVLSEPPHSDAGVKMGMPVSLVRPLHRAQHLRQSSIGQSLETPAESWQGGQPHSRSDAIPVTLLIVPAFISAATARSMRRSKTANSAGVMPYSAFAYSESGIARGKGMAFWLTTLARKTSMAARGVSPMPARIFLAAFMFRRSTRMVMVGMSQNEAICGRPSSLGVSADERLDFSRHALRTTPAPGPWDCVSMT